MRNKANILYSILETEPEADELTADDKSISKGNNIEPEFVVFDFTDAIGKRDTQNALNVLDGLICQKDNLILLLNVTTIHLLKLYQVKKCIEQNKPLNGESLGLKPNQEFLISKYKNHASYFETIHLIKLIYDLENLKHQNKNGNIDLEVELKNFVSNVNSEEQGAGTKEGKKTIVE